MAEQNKENTARRLYLLDEVHQRSAGELIKNIIKFNDEDDEKEKTVKDYEREPIWVYIMSPGGSVYDGMGLVDTILWSKTPVYTVAIGGTMSMGLWIFLCGTKRFIGRKTILMWHDISCGQRGKTEEIEESLAQMKELQSELIKFTLERTKVKKELLDQKLSLKEDWYISSAEAKRLGFATDFWYK